MFTTEATWLAGNYGRLNAVGFGLGVVQGSALLVGSRDGSIPGWSGSPIEQVFWHAVAVVVYLPLTFGLPVLVATSVAWRVAIRVFGHPRATAYTIAAAIVVAGVVAIPRAGLGELALASVAIFAFATIVRPPVGRVIDAPETA